MLTKVHHIHITIPEGMTELAREFYIDKLGLAEINKPEKLKHRVSFWVSLGEIDIHISEEDGEHREGTKAHIAYEVDNLDYLQKRLAHLGLEVKAEIIQLPGYRRIHFRDPFGNMVELIQPNS